MNMYWENGGIAPRILYLGTSWRWVVSFTPRPLYRRERQPPPRCQLDRRLGGPQKQDAVAKRKHSHHCHCREVNPGRSARSLFFILTERPSVPKQNKITSKYLNYFASICLYLQ